MLNPDGFKVGLLRIHSKCVQTDLSVLIAMDSLEDRLLCAPNKKQAIQNTSSNLTPRRGILAIQKYVIYLRLEPRGHRLEYVLVSVKGLPIASHS